MSGSRVAIAVVLVRQRRCRVGVAYDSHPAGTKRTTTTATRRSQIASVVDLSAALFSRGTARLSSEIESETPFPPLRSVRPSFLSTSHQLYHNSNGAPFSSTPRRQQQLLLSNAAFLSSLSERVNDERTNERSIHCLPAKHLCYAAAAAILIPIFFFFSFPVFLPPSSALYPFRCD